MSIGDYVPLNFEMMRHPLNWLIVGLMIVIVALSLHLVFNTAQAPTMEN